MLSALLTALYVVVCLLLLVVVLMQQGKGGDIASAFGGSGSQTAFGARAGASVLTRATTALGAMFMIGAMTLAIMGQGDSSSVLSGVEGPGLQPPAPATVPVEIDPAQETLDDAEDEAEEPAEPQ
jgi:preprotein translocase subunit SecG